MYNCDDDGEEINYPQIQITDQDFHPNSTYMIY